MLLAMSAVVRPAAYDDLLRLPEHVTGEILAGQLHTQPRPSSRHARIETGIASWFFLGRSISAAVDQGLGHPDRA
jgi:hypothetical protein